jgi:nicotinate phosphoribosyltransferase
MDTINQHTRDLALATDLYQLTMAAVYHAERKNQRATFELFVRRFPPNRSYLVAAGLEQALDYLSHLRFREDEIEFLRSLDVFRHLDDSFFDYLGTLRFSGDVWAMPEGTPVFPGEPILRVTAPLIEAQIIETFLLATVNFQTMIASKTARVVQAAGNAGVVEFGGRRAQTMAAAGYAARAAFIAGCIGTSNVEAARAFGIPVMGTAAHSFIMSFADEREAFAAYYRVFPEHTTFLLDTYDTVRAAHLATEFGPAIRGVRLDSGDMLVLSKRVRGILDEGGLKDTRIMASGDLDEEKIAELINHGAPIDFFGVGTEIVTSYDAPALGGVYKMVEVESDAKRVGRIKLSEDKSTYPYAKQVWRSIADDDSFLGDTIAAADEDCAHEEQLPLLEPVMRGGKVITSPLPVNDLQRRARQELERLPQIYRRLKNPDRYPVRYSDKLESERKRLSMIFQ